MSARPSTTDYFLFVKFIPEAIFFFVISKRKAVSNRFYVLDNPGEFAGELLERMRAVYPQEFSDALLELGVRDELNELLAHAGLVEVIPLDEDSPVPDIATFYAKQIQSYMSDLEKPVKEGQIKDIVRQMRKDYLDRFVKNPSLPLTNVPRKNRPFILRARAQKRLAQHKKQQSQLRLMERQDLPLQARHALQHNRNDPDGLAYDLLWLPLGLTDPISLDPIRAPVVLPSGNLIDESSVSVFRLSGRDPMTNLPLGAARLQSGQQVRRRIDALARESDAVVRNDGLTPHEKARHLLVLRQSYQKKKI